MPKTTVKYYMDIDESGAVRGAGRVENSLEDVDRKAKQTESRFNSLTTVMGTAFVGALGLAFQQGVSRAIDKGSEFESQLANLEAITGITGDKLQRLGDRSLELSTEYGTAAAEIIEANKLVASQLAQKIDFNTEAGFQQLQQISEQAVVLQKAAGIQLQEAVATTTSVINQFNLSADESARVINTLAAGSKFGAAEVPAIGAALVNAGAAAAGANQSIETTNAAIQVLAANGQVGERAGTALRAIFTRLKTEGQALAEAGIKNVNIESNGLVGTLKQLEPLLHDTAAAKKIFGEEALNQVQILIRNAEAVGEMEQKVSGTNTAYGQAETNLNTYDGAMNRLWTTLDKRLIQAFTENRGLLVQMINGTTGLVESVGDAIQVFTQLTPILAGVTAAYGAYFTITKASTIATKAAAIAQRAWNLAMKANPIGLIIGLIGGLAGVLYSNSEAWQGFKTLVSGVWDFLVEVFLNLPEVAWNSFQLLGEIMRSPFATLQTFAGNIFDNLASNFWSFLSAIKKGITGDFTGAWNELKSIGASAGNSFLNAASEQMAQIGGRVDALVASADFGPAVDKMAEGGAQLGSAMADMFTLTAKAGITEGANDAATAAGQELSNLSVGPDGNLVNNGSGQALGSGQATNPIQKVGKVETFGASAAEDPRLQAAKELLGVEQQIEGQLQKVGGTYQSVGDIATAATEEEIAARERVAGSIGKNIAATIQYANTVKEAIRGVIMGVINQVIALWVRNAVQTAGASGPAALIVTPALVAIAQKAASAVMSPLLDFEQGGLLSGPLHRNGGIPARVGNRGMVELEGDEFVINRESTRRALPVINAMNADPAFAEQLSNSFTGRSGALTINAMPASSPVNAGGGRDIAGEVSRGIRQGLEQANIVAPVQLRRLDEEQQEERSIERQIGNQV